MMLVSNPNIPALDVGLPECSRCFSALDCGCHSARASEELLARGRCSAVAPDLGMNTVTADQVAQVREDKRWQASNWKRRQSVQLRRPN